MKPKKIAVMYDCGTDFLRGLETRLSITYDPIANENFISAFTLKPNGETTGIIHLELTPEIVGELQEILNNKK